MSYADRADIQGMMAKFKLSASTTPTIAQADDIIDDISAEIDSVIAGAGYAVPVTSPVWFLRALRMLNRYGATSAVLRSMFPQKSGAGEAAVAIESYYATQYQRGLKRLATGEAIPPELATGTAQVKPSTYFTRNPNAEEDLGEIAEPFFKRDTVF